MRPAAFLLLLLLLTLNVSANALNGESAKTHNEINHDALSAEFCQPNLLLIQSGCEAQNKTGSEAEADPRLHFAEEKVSKAVSAMDRQKKLILDFAGDADTNVQDRARSLYHFGLLIHSAQDFYFHTNYVEVLVAQAKAKGSTADPYNMPLIDWSHPPAEPLLGSPEFFKDSQMSAAGKVAIADTDAYKAARELAVRETERQWTLLQALLKLRYPSKSESIVAALKQAACPANLKLDALTD